MIDKPKFFPKAYGLKTQNDINDLYDEWADSYDDEVEENGYVSPARTASALTPVSYTHLTLPTILRV